ncbi:BPL-N domain-containing protein [Botrimarina sp.]|uniref:BPL-N domain-containing protein n=1 Tax=Botrimarina sp. TaxID=2795802 RepID=UPI0032ED8698
MTTTRRPSRAVGRLSLCLPLLLAATPTHSHACTTAVVSGRATPDGRPLLWKNRDTRSSQHNEVVLLDGERFGAIVVVNAGERRSVWMGVNEAGFCIENSLSRDLKVDEEVSGPNNGGFMRMALGRCATVDDFRRLLDETNQSGRTTLANYGVIDAHGGAVLFETGPNSYAAFDANDPDQAPDGIVVRANFATTARGLPARPTPDALAEVYSGERYCRAAALLAECKSDGVSVDELLRRLARDLSDQSGRPYPGAVNGPDGSLPDRIPTASTISRLTTVSAVVFHGVRPGEDPRLTTMWTMLGDPSFTIATPVFPVGPAPDDLADEHGGEIGEIALTLRDWNLTHRRDGVVGRRLPGIWSDLWREEDRLVEQTLEQKNRWAAALAPESDAPVADIIAWQEAAADWAMAAMVKELAEAKQAALAAPVAPASWRADERPADPAAAPRVAVYDHSEPYEGSENLARILTADARFDTRPVTPQQIRDGALDRFDVLVMPGGSGSKQSEKLEQSGRAAIKQFVEHGGGYVGICAGAYLASSQYEWSLGLVNARCWDRVHWARGTGKVRLAMAPAAEKLFDASGQLECYYGQGPMLAPDDEPDLPAYQVLASYATEVAKKGAPEGAMVGMHAIVRSEYGEGRVILFSPHPEKPGGPNGLIAHGVRWAAAGSPSVATRPAAPAPATGGE